MGGRKSLIRVGAILFIIKCYAMNKLLSVMAVAVIVTSAFAFTKGVAAFCVRNSAGTGCIIISGVHTENGTPNYKHFPLSIGKWDGTVAGCTSASISDCSVDIRLVSN
jgi:hypothetical protein